ncbi:HK97-gp10 family putative phage morphogenesis protein [uncultured Azohydromonas sp.]|mgnify:CR=1 FL=1|jgi:phage protein, HK97 gp10 family|uniref:HK97-gp10 family putative phage morphogenesis protein n=1 Tax=uncultured Azohydromonas sp. TaxID=487342 RepID=UPI00262E1154|nr:HK97-gp10 family putative phage morphogenesis protein [uncultured Azohydromonas sp.]
MADSKPEVIGVPELRAAFAELRGADRGARVVVVAGGRVLKVEAKRLADTAGLRRTGAMIDNIVIKREKTPAGSGVAEYHLGVRHGHSMTRKQRKESGKRLAISKRSGRIVTRYENDPWYWRFQHFGTKHLQANPFLSQALENKRTEALTAMQKAALRELMRQRRRAR